jgi:hypothetical protein
LGYGDSCVHFIIIFEFCGRVLVYDQARFERKKKNTQKYNIFDNFISHNNYYAPFCLAGQVYKLLPESLKKYIDCLKFLNVSLTNRQLLRIDCFYKSIEFWEFRLKRGKLMKEREFLTALGIKPDPENNVYRVQSWRDEEELRRIVRIFALKEAERQEGFNNPYRTLASLKLVQSNN